MKVIAPAPIWVHTCTCWNCRTKIEGNADDLVYKTHYVGESANASNDYCFVCPNCKQSNFVKEEKCSYDAMKLARSKGLKNVFEDPDVRT